MQHPTVNMLESRESPETILVLTGPPAAGKSTIQHLLGDFNVPVIDTSRVVRLQAETMDGWEPKNASDLWAVAEHLRDEHGEAAPTMLARDDIDEAAEENDKIVCIGGVREQAEVEWIEATYESRVLVARIDAPSNQRTRRFVERHLEGSRDSVDGQMVQDLRDELYERESREMPYPEHHVTIQNTDETSMSQLTQRLSGLLTAFAGVNSTTSPGETA